jgi:hypothetical protein
MPQRKYNEAKDVPHFYKWRVPIWFSVGEHISRSGCMGEQQALLAASLVETQRQ